MKYLAGAALGITAAGRVAAHLARVPRMGTEQGRRAGVAMVRRSSTTRDRARTRLRAQGAACHICGEPIDYTLPWDNPRAFVADHVIPLARGGADEQSNMRAAHRDCNSLKRARIHAPIIRRSGSLNR